ncbi:alpha 1,4-glycosyltransferase family protein [Actinidia rufa]|uniref:Alpha 1,4-glycosyltransferase family protein n=1 Tax=Actinidia rufa TaxID=165716 RepID=A0A7J0EZI7_9ERIC|nr:alpha 1,4-glycosyltransferase family protein [Actinidia rufa]
MLSLKEENPPSIRKTHFPILQKSKNSVIFEAKRMGKRKPMFKFLLSEAGSDRFSTRVKEFFGSNSCQSRFFMTWISSIDSFGDRELFTVESLFSTQWLNLGLIGYEMAMLIRSLSKLRNVIGAQTIDLETGNWSRLNNAVMVFDKGHPLLYKFIQEFALTFDGNKWGHNGPYLVSRVVSRVKGRLGFDFGILSPMAFYPVDWSRIDGLFWGPRNETHSKWLSGKLNHIRSQSYAVHLWNRQSRKIDIEEGSIIGHLMSDSCVFCNSSALNL